MPERTGAAGLNVANDAIQGDGSGKVLPVESSWPGKAQREVGPREAVPHQPAFGMRVKESISQVCYVPGPLRAPSRKPIRSSIRSSPASPQAAVSSSDSPQPTSPVALRP